VNVDQRLGRDPAEDGERRGWHDPGGPELVADRYLKYAEVVGKENVYGGTDCGIGTRVGHPSLGWAKFRAGRTLHCRLGGTSTGGDITPSEDNAKVILMVLGKSAPQPPAPSGDSYPPGCLTGK